MILDEIASRTKQRIEQEKKLFDENQMRITAEQQGVTGRFPFEEALSRTGISFICEVKKASPSKGIIAKEFPYVQIAKEYELAGASAISVLTEPYYFMGKDEYLKEIVAAVSIPVLRKDFTVDPYQIYQAKVLGASAILCICTILSDQELKDYIELAHSLGLSALVEAHSEQEVKRGLAAGARIIGVNNRNLQTFTVDMNNSVQLRKLVPDDVLFVSESGIKSRADIEQLTLNRTDGVLIGETLMKNPDKKRALDQLRGTI